MTRPTDAQIDAWRLARFVARHGEDGGGIGSEATALVRPKILEQLAELERHAARVRRALADGLPDDEREILQLAHSAEWINLFARGRLDAAADAAHWAFDIAAAVATGGTLTPAEKAAHPEARAPQ